MPRTNRHSTPTLENTGEVKLKVDEASKDVDAQKQNLGSKT